MGIFDRFASFFASDEGAPAAPEPGPPPTHRATMADTSAYSWTQNLGGGFFNGTSGLGRVGVDPTATVGYGGGRVPLPGTIDRIYQYDWLAKRVVEKMPSIAMVRGWKTGDESLDKDFRKLNYTDRHPRGVFQQAINQQRAYGGSVVLLGYRLGNPRTPLLPAQASGGVSFLDVIPQHQLRVLRRVSDASSPDFGMPELYQIVDYEVTARHPRVGLIFHASRCVRFPGEPLRVPDHGLEPNDFTGTGIWPELGVSVLTPLMVTLAQYGLAWSAVSNLMSDANVGVFKMAGLIEALASENKAAIEARQMQMQRDKGVHKNIFLDKDYDEEYSRIETRLQDIPNLLQQFMIQVSGAAEIPAQIFFANSPSGLNSAAGNEGVLTQLYNSCGEWQRTQGGPRLDSILTAVNGGQDVEITWPSLWEASENEKAQTRLATANADKVYWDMHVVEAQDIAKAHQDGTLPELIAKPEDDAGRDEGAEMGEGLPPQGAPGQQGASKIAQQQRKSESTTK